MTKAEVAAAAEWLCPACAPVPTDPTPLDTDQDKETSSVLHEATTRSQDEEASIEAKSIDSKEKSLTSASAGGTESSVDVKKGTEIKFEVGDLVLVAEHGGPGVNNSEGVANILALRENSGGTVVYDVKYVVGGKAKGVFPEYLSPHQF